MYSVVVVGEERTARRSQSRKRGLTFGSTHGSFLSRSPSWPSLTIAALLGVAVLAVMVLLVSAIGIAYTQLTLLVKSMW